MEEKKSSSKKSLILILLLLLIGGYSYYLYDSNAKLNTEKSALIDNLTKSRDSISTVINENSSIKEELLVEQQKITNLIDELKESNATVEELNKYKVEVVKLRKQVTLLKSDKMELVEKYEALKNKQDSTMTVLKNKEEESNGYSNIKTKSPNNSGTSLSDHLNVTKSKSVIFANLTASTFSANKTLTKMVPTDKSEAVNFCRIKFLIRGNSSVSESKGKYYVQIIDPNGDIIGYRLSHKFGSIVLAYSYHEDYSYTGENIEELSGLPLTSLSKGNYTINLFKDDKIVLKSGFKLI